MSVEPRERLSCGEQAAGHQFTGDHAVEALRQDVQALREELGIFAERSELRAELEALRAGSDGLRRFNNVNLDAAKARLIENDKLRAELAEAQRELSVKKSDCAQLCDENAALEADTSELARHVVTVAAQLAEANARVAELEPLAELGRIAVVFAKDCVGDDCMMCAPKVNGAHHDECPVGLFLAKAEASKEPSVSVDQALTMLSASRAGTSRPIAVLKIDDTDKEPR